MLYNGGHTFVYPLWVQIMGKTSNYRIRLEPELHQQFVDACKSQHVPAAQILRDFMRDYVRAYLSTRQSDLFEAEHEKNN